jgi:hypothetical protein
MGAILIAVILSGCHHMVPVVDTLSSVPTAVGVSTLAVGDQVRVRLRNGDSAMCVVAEIRADALVAEDGRRFNYADVARLEKRRVAKSRTIVLIAAMPIIMLVLVGLTYHGE